VYIAEVIHLIRKCKAQRGVTVKLEKNYRKLQLIDTITYYEPLVRWHNVLGLSVTWSRQAIILKKRNHLQR